VEDFQTHLPQIWADQRAVRQICLNLLSNALKFTPRGGRITLTVANLPDGSQMLAVRDTGPGIPPEEMPKVLQAFGQGSLAHQIAEGGTGLGLPIVQNLSELHGGVFELRSELRKGTDAIVIFPKKRVLAEAKPAEHLPAGSRRDAPSAAASSPRRARLRLNRPQVGTAMN
jgi:two-component system cell cycle sensor histidine kinase PleC